MLMQKMSSLAHVDAGAAICASIPKRYDGNSSFAWPAVHEQMMALVGDACLDLWRLVAVRVLSTALCTPTQWNNRYASMRP